MSEHEKKPDSSTSVLREPYEAPRVLETSEFENLAMACAKSPTSTFPVGCRHVPLSG